MHEPASFEEAARLLRELSSRRRTIGISGGDAPRGPSVVPVDEILSTRRMDRIVEYVPSDQIVSVEAGMPVGALQSHLAERAQRLAIDPPEAHATTVGGMVAANAYGPLRTQYGTVKDLIVGMTIVRVDGTIARGGGKVVKNVAGFDIPKLMVGTYGTLALIGSVTFRLHPLPRASAQRCVDALDAQGVRRVVRAMTDAQLEPSAVVAVLAEGGYTLAVRFEGFASGVDAQCEAFAALAHTSVREGNVEAAHDAARSHGTAGFKITAPASHLPDLHEHVIRPLCGALLDSHACVYPAAGIAFVSGDAADVASLASAAAAARAWVQRRGGSLVLERAPRALGDAVDRWGAPPPAFALMRALKDRFDPGRVLLPGGFVGGL